MRVSDFFKFRYWSAGMIGVVIAGQATTGLWAQVPSGSPPPSMQSSDSRAVSGAPAATANGSFTPASGVAANPTAMLLRARQALAVGDVNLATSLVEQARSSGVDFSATGDSPDTVAKMIAKQNELAELSRTGDANQYNQAAAMFLMEQAEQMVKFQDWATAEKLVAQSQMFPVDFKKLGRDPLALKQQIDSGKQQVAAKSATGVSDALRLMSEAQLAFDKGDLNQAKILVGQAKALNVPDSAFAANQTRPWQMELTVDRAMAQRGSATQASYNLNDPSMGLAQAGYVKENDTTKNAPVGFTQGGQQAMEEVDSVTGSDEEQVLFRQMQAQVFKKRAESERAVTQSPRSALDQMLALRNEVANSTLSDANKTPLLKIVDRDISEIQRYIEQNLPEILNHESNSERQESWNRGLEEKYNAETQIQKLVADFERLVDEQRFAEAEQVARQAYQLAPEDPVVVLLNEKAKLVVRMNNNNQINGVRETNQQLAMGPDVYRAATPMPADTPLQMTDADTWSRLTMDRREQQAVREYRSEAERRIWNLLKNEKVQGVFRGPLSSTIEQLASQAGVNIVFDVVAMDAEKITTSAPVDVSLQNAVSLKSALEVIVNQVGLVYVVDDELIRITSRTAQRRAVAPRTYYVGDLIAPLTPPHSPMQMNFITPYTSANSTNTVLAQNQAPMANVALDNTGRMNQTVLAQQMSTGMPFGSSDPGYGFGPQRGIPTYTTMGGSQLGGITIGDFLPLMNLIRTTIDPESWDDNQGDGTIQPYVANLSLIVTNTQEVQDQIQDLLNKLRELNDVQIVVEVRFVTLSDNFFEQIGIDFDFRINDNSGLAPGSAIPDLNRPSRTIGIGTDGQPTGDLDVAFGQQSFGSAIPTFGGFDPATAANFGFAILSDIEVFFLIQASKGDTRSNITQAPVVTMFNGQSANIFDGALQPFVTSVIPVVGDFAVAHQPVISILPSGASLNVQATVSSDRRFVKLSLVPFFSQVTDVEEFTFDGRRTTRRSSTNFLDDLFNGRPGGGGAGDDDDLELEVEETGVTVQLPVVASTFVNTVVSVPDGGTILMGGIKRMSEGRTERGVPFLSNIPYVNRLFKNVGIGRETSNLMMMVTPRIIIQEEEERAQVGPIGGNN